METQFRPLLIDDPGVWFGIATGSVVLTLFVCGVVGLSSTGTAVAALAVAGLAAIRLPDLVALALGVIAWAFFTGFTENAYGQLSFSHGDLLRLALFAGVTVAISRFLRRESGNRSVVGHG